MFYDRIVIYNSQLKQSYLNSLLTLQAQQALVLRKLIWSESEGGGGPGVGFVTDYCTPLTVSI